MIDEWVEFIQFHQYGGETEDDLLWIFAAPASDLARWAGIPRKGWHIRMLYQRWVEPRRERDLATFWESAASRDNGSHILGPTAVTLAVQQDIETDGTRLRMKYESPIDFSADPIENLQRLSATIEPKILVRLSAEQREFIAEFREEPIGDLPDVEHDYVFEFALQLIQMTVDPEWFVSSNEIEPAELNDLLVSLEALCRPALVVDGQHRLMGAVDADAVVLLPTVAMPNSDWVDQIYQFIVINEKAEKVETSLLTDIFGSSLTQEEQVAIRERLERAGVDVEPRIAAVIANRDPESPFYQMVRLRLGGAADPHPNAYVTDTTIRLLIDGGGRYSRAWRSDDEFFEKFVQPTIPEELEWKSWNDGLWRPYWFAFWRTVGEFYNDQAAQTGRPPLWDPEEQSNLTKAVTLRVLQKLFMDKVVSKMEKVEEMHPILIEELGPDIAEKHIVKRRREYALPDDPEAFPEFVEREFLSNIPVRIFLKPWVKNLDDQEGMANLYGELEQAFERTSAGQSYWARNAQVYAAGGE